ncbi:MAG: hypothetical protein AB8D78_15060 [Akkermansiaceae bacterium]
MKTILLLAPAVAALFLGACKKEKTEVWIETEPSASATFEEYFTTESIEGAEHIHVARTSAKPGDAITLKGEVMGREKVFVEGRASFILGDPTKLTTCDKMPGDSCTTPWDACCDSKESKRIGIASIQLVDEDGRVLDGNIKGVNGLKEISFITVSGTVAENSTEDNLIVNATKIHLK